MLGFSHARDFFRRHKFVTVFPRVCALVARINFRRLDGLAQYLGTCVALEDLQTLPLVPSSDSQVCAIGATRVEGTIIAPLRARSVSAPPQSMAPLFLSCPPDFLEDPNMSTDSRDRQAVRHVAGGSLKPGVP